MLAGGSDDTSPMPATPPTPPRRVRIVIALLWVLFACVNAAGWWLLLVESHEAAALTAIGLSLPVMLTAAGATRWQRRQIQARFHAESLAAAPRTGGGVLSRLLDALWP